MKKLILSSFALLLTIQLLSQEPGKTYEFKQIGWTITIPADFVVIDSADNYARMERGKKALEDANGVKADITATITLISASKNVHNYFNSTITPFDSTKTGNYVAASKDLKNMVYKTMAGKISDGKIDSITTTQTINGVSFDKFSLLIDIPDKISFHMILLLKLYKGYSFGITYVYLDDKIGEQIETMLRNSKFNK